MLLSKCLNNLQNTTNTIKQENIDDLVHSIFTYFTERAKKEIILEEIDKAINLMKGKAVRKYSLHEKTAASVLLKMFISSNE